jgi:hypothetical protein
MSNSLYMLRMPGSKLFRPIHTIILVTSRDCNHITWSRNSVSVSLLATLSHRTWIANDFSSSQLFQKRSKLSDCTFWKFFYKQKFFFLFISCTRKRHSTVIEDYIKRNDVILCELDCLAFIEIESKLHFLKFVVQTKKFFFDSICVREIDTQQWSWII